MKNNIDLLLEKYWEGETTVEDEKELKEYFRSESVAVEHLEYRPLFNYFDAMANVEMPHNQESKEKANVPVIPIQRWLYAAAAMFVLLMGTIQLMKYDMSGADSGKFAQVEQKGEIEDPEEALRVAKQALAMVSSKINRGKHKVSAQLSVLDKADIFR